MIAADWGYAIPAAMVTAGGLWLGDVIIDGVRSWWMDYTVRRTQIVEGAGASACPRTAAAPSTPHAEPVALPVHPEASASGGAPFDSGISVFDWAADPDLADDRDSMCGTAAEVALAGFDAAQARSQVDVDRRFADILRAESQSIHPSNGAPT